MVHLVILRGPANAIDAVQAQLTATSAGWFTLAPGLMLVAQQTRPPALSEFLSRYPGVQVAVLQLSGMWATNGRDDLAQWLRGANGMF
jgi:hypothetical protein